jgi:hypothetical protein
VSTVLLIAAVTGWEHSISLALFSQTMHFQNREDRASSECASAKNHHQTLLPAERRDETKDERDICRGNSCQQRSERHPLGDFVQSLMCCFQSGCHVNIASLPSLSN